jgi:predicted DNA-binding transcriptional regulator AlpA
MNTNTTSNTTDTADMKPRLALRPKEAARALGIGERLLWSLTNQGLIPHLRLGKAVVYPIASLERFLAEQVVKGARR